MIQIDIWPVWSEIRGNYVPMKALEEACSYFKEGAQYSPAFQRKKWDGKIRLMERTGRFPTGLWFIVRGVLDSLGLEYTVVPRFTWPERQFDWKLNSAINARPRQLEAVEAILKRKRGMMELPTRFGKTTVVASKSIAEFAVPTLFLAHQLDLVYDAAKIFEEFIDGVDSVGIMGGGKVEYKPITCACVDTLYNHLDDPKMQLYLREKVKYLVLDESHMYTTGQYKKVVSEVNAPYRLFFSATIERGDGSILESQGASGDVIFKLGEEKMIQEGYISDVEITMVPFEQGLYNEDDSGIKYREFYDAVIVKNARRNQLIVDSVKSLLSEGRFVLVLVSRTDHNGELSHGRIIKELLAEQGVPDAEFIFGDVNVEERSTVKDAFNAGKFRVLIGSTVADVGANFPVASGLVLAGSGDSQTRSAQRIGRILCNAEGKLAKAIDIRDENVKFFSKQAQSRMDYYISRFGDKRVSYARTLNGKTEIEKLYPFMPGMEMFSNLL